MRRMGDYNEAQELVDYAEILMIDQPGDILVQYVLSFGYIAVGNPEVLADEVAVLNDREVLLLGRSTGRTTLMLWYQDGTVETRNIAVELNSATDDLLVTAEETLPGSVRENDGIGGLVVIRFEKATEPRPCTKEREVARRDRRMALEIAAK